MITWLIDGWWKHNEQAEKKIDCNHRYRVIVTTDNNDNPMEVLNEIYDLSGMTYLRGNVTQIISKQAFNLTPGDGINTPALIEKS